MIQPLKAEWLTKKFFMSLPDGVYLASNVGLLPGQPCFAKTVLPLAQRPEQWKRIVEARVNNRLCDVFADPKDYMLSCLESRYRRERN